MKKEKKFIVIILATIGFLGSIASIVTFQFSSEKFPILESFEKYQVSNGGIILGVFLFIGLLAILSKLNNQAHNKYHDKLVAEVAVLKETNEDHKSRKTKIIEQEEMIKCLKRDLLNKSQYLERLNHLENELFGIFKSGNEYGFDELRRKIDADFSDGDIYKALTALGEKITSSKTSEYRTSKYIKSNA